MYDRGEQQLHAPSRLSESDHSIHCKWGQVQVFTLITDQEGVIYQQKFEGAAADMLNASIFVRELGLVDRQNITDDSAVPVTSITYVEVDASRAE